MRLFGLGPKIEGEIGYFKLADWWLTAFTEKERQHIESVFHPITKGTITATTQTAAQLLWTLAMWFEKPQDRSIARRILEKAEELAEKGNNALDQHFTYQCMVQVYYKDRDTDDAALPAAIAACEKQIAVAPKAAKAFKRESPKSPLPAHVGYTQLAIIREKEGDLAEAIRLSKQAMKQGWDGDWETRIARCEKKLAKQAGKAAA